MKCKICGKEFTAYNKSHLYCCRECKYQAKKKKHVKKPLFEKKCEYCGEVFIQKKTTQRYCCKKCCDTHRREFLKVKITPQVKKSTMPDLKACARKAKESGMSYGMYVAQTVKIERKW